MGPLLEFREGADKSDLIQVHEWLSSTYWQPGVSLDRVKRAGENSAMVVNGFWNEQQVSYLRVISDLLTFAWIADVFVDPAFRKKGIAKSMLSFVIHHERFKELNRWTLATSDAHGLYEQFGFSNVKPGVMMHRLDPEYQRLTGF